MGTRSPRTSAMPAPPLPPALAAAWGLLAAWAVALVWWLVRYWGLNPEYADRLIIPPAAVWLVARRAALFRTLPRRPWPAGLVLVAAGAGAFPPAQFLYAQVGPRPLLLWWAAGCWLAAA